MTQSDFADLLFSLGLQLIWLLFNLFTGYGHWNLHLLSGCLLQVDHYSTPFAALLLTYQSIFGSTNRCRWWIKCIRCSYIQKLMDQFLLFTVGPLLLSVKGIIDLAQMPPTILLPHPGGTGTPTLERIAYLPGAQPPFPPRAFNPTSISPGEDPSLPHPLHPMFPYLPCHDLCDHLHLSECSPALAWGVNGQFCLSSHSWVFLQSGWEGFLTEFVSLLHYRVLFI